MSPSPSTHRATAPIATQPANGGDRSDHRPAPVAGLLPGLAAAAGLTALATLVGGIVPLVGAPVIAIVTGMAIAAARRPGPRFAPGLTFTSRKVLQGAVVVLGTGLSFKEVVATNQRSLPVLVGTLVVALVVAQFVGRRLRLPADVTTLVGVGTAICGASAIAATDAVIEADQADVGYAVATIFTFNVAAVLTFPSIGHALGLSQQAFGLWAGTAVNDVSSVVAASTVYGHAATAYAVVVKLTRTLAIVPITVIIAAWRNRRAAASAGPAASVGSDAGAGVSHRVSLRRVFPLFLVGFAIAVAVNSFGLVPAASHAALSSLATWMITAALAAIGLSTDLGRLRQAGARPIALGAILWATVAVTSLGLQLVTGTI